MPRWKTTLARITYAQLLQGLWWPGCNQQRGTMSKTCNWSEQQTTHYASQCGFAWAPDDVDDDGCCPECRGKVIPIPLDAMPTGPWVEGDTPEEKGRYLIQFKWAGYADSPVYFEVDEWWDGWETPGHVVLRHARINEQAEAGGE